METWVFSYARTEKHFNACIRTWRTEDDVWSVTEYCVSKVISSHWVNMHTPLYLIRGWNEQRGNILDGAVVEKDRLVLWSLNTTNLKSAIDQSEQRHCDGLQCVYGQSNTLQQWEKIWVMYSWVLRELLRRDIKWGITVGSSKRKQTKENIHTESFQWENGWSCSRIVNF